MAANTTKQRLIHTGAKLVHMQGFNNTGIQDILQRAGVPKGSFYFYFKSKEEFGISLIEHYTAIMKSVVHKFCTDDSLTPLQRLEQFFSQSIKVYKDSKFKGGCPVGNLAQEMSCHSEPMREKLLSAYKQIQKELQQCIEEGQKAGQIDKRLNAESLASFILDAWEGALINMKVSKSTRPLEIVADTIIRFLGSY